MSETTHESTVIEAETARVVGRPLQTNRSDRARTSAYRLRFAFIYVVLAVVAGVTVGWFLVLADKPADPPEPAWSSFAPDGSRDARVRQIADHVSTRYRLPSGNQLAAAWGGPPKVSTGGDTGELPVSAIILRPDTSTGQAEDTDYTVVRASDSVMYILCGVGESCSIAEGEASPERLALLRREALELALYTFTYADGVDSVTVLLPPAPDGASSPVSVFLERSDVSSLLSRPLARTLSAKVPGIGEMPVREVELVEQATQPRLYTYEYQQAQDLSALLVLSQIPPS